LPGDSESAIAQKAMQRQRSGAVDLANRVFLTLPVEGAGRRRVLREVWGSSSSAASSHWPAEKHGCRGVLVRPKSRIAWLNVSLPRGDRGLAQLQDGRCLSGFRHAGIPWKGPSFSPHRTRAHLLGEAFRFSVFSLVLSSLDARLVAEPEV